MGDWRFEFFGGRAAIPVQDAYVVVSLPQNCVALNTFYSFVPAKTFASDDSSIIVDYIKEVLIKGLSAHGKSGPGLYANWGETENIQPSTPSQEGVFPLPLDPDVIRLQKRIDHLDEQKKQLETRPEQDKLVSELDALDAEREKLEKEKAAKEHKLFSLEKRIKEVKDEEVRLKSKSKELRTKPEQDKLESELDALDVKRGKLEEEKTAVEHRQRAYFFDKRYVFAAKFATPNPLTFQMLFWPLPELQTAESGQGPRNKETSENDADEILTLDSRSIT